MNSEDSVILCDFNNEDIRQLPINTELVTLAEIRKATHILKNNKSPDIDYISAEMLKASEEEFGLRQLQRIKNLIWRPYIWPYDWKKRTIIKLPKKKETYHCKNWRDITLLSVPGKVMSLVIMNRIQDGIQNILRQQQAGFRKNRGCPDHLLVLRNIIEQCEEMRSPLVMNFVDFMRAFDSIQR